MLDLFTVVWGKMGDSFLEGTLPSLLQPGNIPASKGQLGTYSIYTNPLSRAEIEASPHYAALSAHVTVEWEDLQKGVWEVNSNVLAQLKKSLTRGNFVLVVSPDWAIGDGSVKNLATLCAKGDHNPILYGFPRLTELGWRFLVEAYRTGERVTNRQLVTLAMKHLDQATYRLEVAVFDERIVHNNALFVYHNVPTPCLRPDPFIVEAFAANPTLNSGFDHALPFILVEKGYPWLFIDQSDTYFQVERGRHLITEQVQDEGNWMLVKAMKGLEFFGGQKALWQGV